jgi:acyl carrier protein
MGKSVNNSYNSPKERIVVIAERLLQQRSISHTLADEDSFEDVGMNSLDLAKLVLLVEDEFGLVLGKRDITPANFRSVSALSRLVVRLLRPRPDTQVKRPQAAIEQGN